MAKKKKNYSPSSWEAHFELLKKDTGLNGWQIYLISGILFVIFIVCILEIFFQ